MPFEVRMSMFLVECETLNDDLVKECDEIITLMLNKIAEYVQVDLATRVSSEVRTIQQKFSEKASTTKELVAASEYLEDVKNKKRNEIVKDYNDVMDWMYFLYNYPQAMDEI